MHSTRAKTARVTLFSCRVPEVYCGQGERDSATYVGDPSHEYANEEEASDRDYSCNLCLDEIIKRFKA